jgi:serine/threonine-protein kinase
MPRKDPEQPLLAPQAPSRGSSISGISALAPEIIQRSARRVGFIGLIAALTAPASYLVERAFQPERVVLPGAVPFPALVAGGMLVMGLAVFASAWSRKLPPALVLDLGLIFEVVGAFAISLSENAGLWVAGQPVRGISWNCIWITIFAIAVPGSFGKIILAALTAACMGPLGLAVVNAVNPHPLPSNGQLLLLFLPPFAAAGWAIPAARHIHSLGAQLSKERELGSYRLVEPLGRGGMGEVWRAEHRLLARTAAIKLIRSEAGGGPGADPEVLLRRFDREARATAALRSPHTVTLYDYGVSQEGRFYYVMELLHGADLESIVSRFGPMPPGRVVYLLRQACKSLAEAHDCGLVHRDLKPRNIFLCSMGVEYDFVKVLDFGLVKYESEDPQKATQLTAHGVVAGTPAYMAPEAAEGREADARSDLYSLGCVAYFMLSGHPVFECKTAMATLMAHVQTPPTPLSERPGSVVPRSLDRVILACLEKRPERRPRSALELSDLLEACEGVPAWTNGQAERWWSANLKEGRSDSEVLRSSAETL